MSPKWVLAMNAASDDHYAGGEVDPNIIPDFQVISIYFNP